jgi:hypothetical protein
MGICLHGVEAINKIWKNCCAFHNILLEVDGLDSQWEGELVGMNDEADLMNHINNFALHCLHNANLDIRPYGASGMGPDVMNHINNFALQYLYNANLDIRSYDASGMGPGDDVNGENMPRGNPNDDSLQDDDSYESDAEIILLRSVRNMTMDFFFKKLLKHLILSSNSMLLYG